MQADDSVTSLLPKGECPVYLYAPHLPKNLNNQPVRRIPCRQEIQKEVKALDVEMPFAAAHRVFYAESNVVVNCDELKSPS